MRRYGATPRRQAKLSPLAGEGQGTHPGEREGNRPRVHQSVLVLLCALAFTPAAAKDTGLIFVSNEKTNNIVVIDPASFKIVKEIKTARRPRDLHFSADHSKLYVACGDDDMIDIVDVAKLQVVGKLKTGPSPEAFGIDEKRGRLYVSDEEGSSLAVIDMERDTIVLEVPTGAEPEGVLVSEDGKTVYVTSEAGDLLHEVEADSGKVVRDLVAGLRPRRIAATPDGKDLWVTAELAGEVDIVDRATFVITGKIPFLPPGMRKSDVTPVGLVMTKDGKTANPSLILGVASASPHKYLARSLIAVICRREWLWGCTGDASRPEG
jgi:DNA-binding beta-propeller fold protein YncE